MSDKSDSDIVSDIETSEDDLELLLNEPRGENKNYFDVDHPLIFVVDFWIEMRIIPDLHSNVWDFVSSDLAFIELYSSLTVAQQRKLNATVQEFADKMGNEIGCTHLVDIV
ncbi:hypothetical protein FQA39_LY18486 [Lamprigera yunnana]|nr:hypothetical protein FQA39_LY18486 [Lamprigera yunnana]